MSSGSSEGGGVWLIIIAIVGGWYYFKGQDRWEGFVYPDKDNLSKHFSIGEYKTLEDCRAQALKTLHTVSDYQAGSFMCGLNCRSDDSLPGMRICKETAR